MASVSKRYESEKIKGERENGAIWLTCQLGFRFSDGGMIRQEGSIQTESCIVNLDKSRFCVKTIQFLALARVGKSPFIVLQSMLRARVMEFSYQDL